MSDDLDLADEVSLIAHSIDKQMPDSAKILWKLADAITKIEQWAKAYPESVFIPMSIEDWKQHHEILKRAQRSGPARSGSAAAADNMRHVALGIQKILDEVMK